MKITELYKYYKTSSGVSIDSRSISKDELFFALKGPNFDGHKYVDQAFGKGAKYAIIDDAHAQVAGKTLLVSNVEKALQGLARYHRCMLQIPVIGITGSNGKTTTKELISAVLSMKYDVFATQGNLNNHLGVPLSVLSIKEHHEIAIIEMGANHIKEIEFLSEISQPDIGLITNIGKAHLEGFGSLEGVRIGKTELYKYIEKTNGLIFYHEGDEKLVQSLPENTTNIKYSILDAQGVSNYPTVAFSYQGIIIRSNLSGAYNLVNMIAAIRIGQHFSVPIEWMKKGIEDYIPDNNRSELKKTDANTLILDAYNANPSSMAESIKNFGHHPAPRKILILGHMLEMGDDSKVEHERLIELISQYDWEKVFLVGQEFYLADNATAYTLYKSTEELSNELKKINLSGYTILLKGSRGIALERCVEYL